MPNTVGSSVGKTASKATVSKVEIIPGQHRDPNSAVVVIDPGHQLRGDSTNGTDDYFGF